MRFSATIDDPKSFEALIEAASCAASFSNDEELTLKILPDGLAFVCATGAHQCFFMEIKLLEHQVFSTFKMEGISDEKNFIVMQLMRAQFVQILKMQDEQIKIKLVRRENQPQLVAEFKDSGLVKSIPVKLVKSHFLIDYITPEINPAIVGLHIKPIDSFKDIFNTHINFEMEAPQMRLVGDGNLYIKSRNFDGVELDMVIEDLECVDDVEHLADTGYFYVKVEVLLRYFNCLPAEARRCEIRVSDLHQIVINVKHSNADHVLYMSALRSEAFEHED